MKALVYTGVGQLELRETPAPEADFVVKVLGCGICGTDLKTYSKGHHMFPPPAVLGHEFYGLVERTAPGSGFSVGEPVVVAPYAECGACALCSVGAGTLCRHKSFVEGGAFCEYVGIPADYVKTGVFRIPAADDAYTLVEPLACVLNGVAHLKLRATSKVLVVGAGPMGALFALLFKARGIPVTVVEPGAMRREAVAAWGIDAREPGVVAAGEYDNIVIAVNRKELVEDYVKFVADAGALLMFAGLGKGEAVAIDSYAIHYREVTLSGCSGYALPHFKEALELINEHRDIFSRVISDRMPLARGEEAFAKLQAGRAFKIVLKPGAEGSLGASAAEGAE
jgi:L-iditol 2-dehydrogenase